MILPIVAYSSSVLREKAKNINKDFSNLSNLINDMFETMYDAHGVGLAAPQINKSIRLFIIDTSPFSDDDDDEIHDEPIKKIFINPIITAETGEDWLFNEGCLSIPDIREDIARKSDIEIEYFDENFKKHKEKFNGITARVIQHEYDHLEGILFVDKLSPLRKRMIKGKLADIANGKVRTSYKMRWIKG